MSYTVDTSGVIFAATMTAMVTGSTGVIKHVYGCQLANVSSSAAPTYDMEFFDSSASVAYPLAWGRTMDAGEAQAPLTFPIALAVGDILRGRSSAASDVVAVVSVRTQTITA